jgi:hypothetical protein
LQAAQARLAQYDATRTADGVEAGAKRFFIRAPIGGILCPGLSVMVAANNEIVFSSALGMADVE